MKHNKVKHNKAMVLGACAVAVCAALGNAWAQDDRKYVGGLAYGAIYGAPRHVGVSLAYAL
jgi:hypothetical protein